MNARNSNSNITRGGLRPGSITNLSNSSKVVKFHFNPHEFSISKSNTWAEKESQGNNIPAIHFEKGGPQTLSLALHFDTQPEGTPVTSVTNTLWEMMLVVPAEANQKTGKSQPPIVEFKWGPLLFKSIITQMSEKFTLFSDGGVPLRSEISISLQQYVSDTATGDELGFQTGNVPAPDAQQVTSSDRIDLLAASMTGSASGWKALAAANGIANPLALNNMIGSTITHTT